MQRSGTPRLLAEEGKRMKTILCIGAGEPTLNQLKTTVEQAGYEAVTAASGQEALDLFASQTVDGVLLDCRLPDQNGVTVRRRMTHMNPEIPVLMFDGAIHPASIGLRCIEAYIQKPDPPDSLLNRAAGERKPRTNG